MPSKSNATEFKVSIIGCGSVGATTAYAYLLSGTVTKMALLDREKAKANGLKLDLEHARSLTPNVYIEHGDDYKICKNSDLIVITAGKRQAKGETRLDLVKANKRIMDSIIKKAVKVAPKAIYLIVSNPVDVLTYQALKSSKLPKNQVFGSGTLLDSSRLQFHVSEKLKIHPSSIDTYVLGEHGDTSFPVFSSANVLGKPLYNFPGFTKAIAQKCYQDTRNAAYRIIHDQGYTCYSIAAAIREITDALFQDKKKVFPVSVFLEDYYGHSDVCLSVPCVIGKKGIENIIHVPLDENEQRALTKSVDTLKAFL